MSKEQTQPAKWSEYSVESLEQYAQEDLESMQKRPDSAFANARRAQRINEIDAELESRRKSK